MNIPNYSRYQFVDGDVLDTASGKRLKPITHKGGSTLYFKLKDDSGVFKSVSELAIKRLVLETQELPAHLFCIPDAKNYFIDKTGKVYSCFTGEFVELKQRLSTKGYPVVRVSVGNKRLVKEVHWLMCHTFIMEKYSEFGYCCLHLDNNKENNKLSNLRVGTYSENNRAAYSAGLNPGNRLKKKSAQEVCSSLTGQNTG